MKKFIEFRLKQTGEDLLPPKKFHCYGDWLSIGAKTPKPVIHTAYFACSVRLTARTAEVLGRTDEAKKYRKLYNDIKEAFNRAYVADDGRINGDTQCCYVLALANDLVDGEKRKKAEEYLVEKIKKRDWHLSTGFIGTKDLMLTLTKIGRTDVAYRLLHNDTFPSWGFSIKHGATSIWERWDGWTPEKGFQKPGMNSFAHYSFGAVYQWMFENIGGIHSDGPGYRKIIIQPRPGGKLTWAKVSYESIYGRIATAWKIEDGLFKLDVTVPPNTSAKVYVPGGTKQSAKDGAKFLETADGCAIFAVGSGKYRFISNF